MLLGCLYVVVVSRRQRERSAAIVDIYPTIVEHMRFELPGEIAAKLEGQSLLSE
mgnify:CR=1 FL=1